MKDKKLAEKWSADADVFDQLAESVVQLRGMGGSEGPGLVWDALYAGEIGRLRTIAKLLREDAAEGQPAQ